MKVLSAIVIVSFTFLSILAGCSREEEHQAVSKPAKVVRHIVRPQSKRVQQAPGDQKEQASQPGKSGTEIKVASLKEQTEISKKSPDTKQAPPLGQAPDQYIVKKNETLSSIAGRKDIYHDPVKWPILYHLNLAKLAGLGTGEDFPHRPLPEGMKLKVISLSKAKEKIEKSASRFWVVNVLSGRTDREIIPPALRLLKEGYPVYISSTVVKGRQWMRLRVGFFKSKREADAVGKKVQKDLNFGATWSTKAKKEEFEEFGGFSSQGKAS